MGKTLAALCIALLLTFIALVMVDMALAEKYTIYAEADAHVESANPDSNFGSSQSLEIYHYASPSSTAYTYLRYSWQIATIDVAELHLVAYFYGDADGATLSLHYCSNDGWSESSITWNNKPSFNADPIATKVLEAGGIASSIYCTTWEPDISSLAQGESDRKLSFVLTLEYGTAWIFSKEDVEGRGNSNYLTLTYGELPGGKIDEAEIASDKMRVCAELYHDGEEAIEEHDYYAVLVTVEDLKYKNTTGMGQVHPFLTGVQLEMNGWCDEFPANHVPVQGDYGSSQTSIGFSGGGLISYSIRGSAYRVYFDKWYNATTDKFYCRWIVKFGILLEGILDLATGYPWVDYVQFAIQIRVPENYKPTVNIVVGNIWYKDYIGYYAPWDADELWTKVDPPNATPIPAPVSLNMQDEGTKYKPEFLSISSSSGGTTDPSPGNYTYSYGSSVTVTATSDTDFSFAHWSLDGIYYYENPINVTMNANHDLTAYFYDPSSGGGSGGDPGTCPTLFVWNGSDYVDYGVINIHNPSGEDVIREVPVLKEDVATTSYKAYFKLREGWPGLNFSESVIDQVRLYAVIDGNRLPCPLINATHSKNGNVLLQLLVSDDWKTQTLLLETIDLTFIMPYPTSMVQNYVFVIEGCNMFKE